MNEKQKYALEWYESAQYFLEQKSYSDLAKTIKKYSVVLEIGCGTGQSTLSLLEAGHSVIAVDQNEYCIEKAKKLIQNSEFELKESAKGLVPNSVCFYECDIMDPDFYIKILPELNIDVVICWNVGTYCDKNKLANIILKMLEYGLSIEQIKENLESSYAELIIWHACNIAKIKECAVNIVDRGSMPIWFVNDTYYKTLKKEFGFRRIKYSNIRSTALSNGGVMLITDGQLHEEKEVPIVFVSVLMK